MKKSLTKNGRQMKSQQSLLLTILLLILGLTACQKGAPSADFEADVVMIGAGIMSATLGTFLLELEPDLKISTFERLDGVALESSSAWNNAGTGHAAYCELNYTPQKEDGSIDIGKAININKSFEISKQFWAYLLRKKALLSPKSFINKVQHISFVSGEENVSFLRKRYETLKKNPLFAQMSFSSNRSEISQWVPLIMKERSQKEVVAATKIEEGTDVNFGALTKGLFQNLKESPSFSLKLRHEVVDLVKEGDWWIVIVKDLQNGVKKHVRAKFVFVGAGGGALPLMQKSKIQEIKGYGGFPVGGQWLVTQNPELVAQHKAKVYGKASMGAPPMSVPHLDLRVIGNKKYLLFGPFATFSTKFLKEGSWTDLFTSVNFANISPMFSAAFKNLDLTWYLLGQLILTESQRVEALRAYMPTAKDEDWRLLNAGQRVQIIKKSNEYGGVLQFGTEVISGANGTIVALLGASPGASVSAKIALDILKISFKEKYENQWVKKLQNIIPLLEPSITEHSPKYWKIREKTDESLGIK